MEQQDLTIIIPTLNEEKNIKNICDQILEHLPSSRILVVDDGSRDTTQEIVRGYGNPVSLLDRTNEISKGLSISIRDGIVACETDYFMVIDGDLQHPPESLIDALDCFSKGGEVVIGYRVKVEDWPFQRKMLSWGAQTLGNLSLFLRRRQRPRDIMSGFFGAQRGVVVKIIDEDKITYQGYKFLFDLLKHLPKYVKIEQFGYVFKNREYGTSKIGKTHIWEFFKSLF